MAEKGKALFRVVINGPQQAIFDEITRTDRLLGAIYNARMHVTGTQPGAHMQMRTESGKHTLVVGEIVEYDPPRRFAHTHQFTQHGDPSCLVTYELKPVTGGIEVTMTVDDMPLGTRTGKAMASGGQFILDNLKAIVETGRPPLMTRMMYAAMGSMEFVLPAKTKAENWPLDKS
ncbi:MAG: SRPBCC domain-containing protein [Usitatibacter sp.]